MSIETWLLAVCIGGVLGMDAVSFPQVMVARPLVAGTLGGWLAGEPALGLWVGAILEIVSTRQIPMGGARYHDTGPAAFAAGLAYAEAGASSSSLLLATAAGLVLGWAGSWTVHAQRRLNERLVAPLARAARAPGGLVRRHLSALGCDYLRATLLTGLWIVAARALLDGVLVPAGLRGVAGALLLLAAAGALGVALRTVARGRQIWPGFGTGALAGALAVWWWT